MSLNDKKRPIWMGMQRVVMVLASLSVWKKAYFRNRFACVRIVANNHSSRRFLNEHPDVIAQFTGPDLPVSLTEYYHELKRRIAYYKEPIRVDVSATGEFCTNLSLFMYSCR